MKTGLSLLTAATLACIAPSANAVEREHHLGADLGGTALVIGSDKTDVGGTIGGHWAYGLDDTFNLMAEANASLVALNEKRTPKTPTTRPVWVAHAGAGVAYVFDVLQWVPYVGVLAGGYTLGGGTLPHTRVLAGGALAFGMDYRLSRQWCAGVAVREHLLLTDLTTYPSFTQVLARVEYTWGW